MFSQSLAAATIFHGAHPEAVSEFVNRHIGGHHLDLIGGENRAASLSFREFAGFGLSRISYGNHVRVKTPALEDVYHFQVVTRGECRWRSGSDKLALRRGQALMVNPDEAVDLEYSPACEKIIIKVPMAVMNTVQGTDSRANVRFSRTPVDLRGCPSLTSVLDAVFAEFDEVPEGEPSEISGSYREIILKKLLKVFPSNQDEMTSGAKLPPGIHRILRFIEENVKEEIDVKELSEVSNMSTRSIYNAFSRAFSTTPKAYVKQVKLRNLREDLLQGRCRNVTEVALDYGFSHLGRFSSDYRKLFGELPSETLRLLG
ncbi:AraC family transcriptional regulator [Marinobacter salinexigens]|uniref:AraC family transcriptional regulator n=1 Tax=Marinobacter salinexigens TaxID=2919747 RepID=A0A5B0V858_9GAMM|nr:AraC family transcriptional regulator [Marinobacter salinexigens]KAA1170842.1 AraC family transcriptional regulator [Marinobacter salinexigens]